jgi:hypothetical protein
LKKADLSEANIKKLEKDIDPHKTNIDEVDAPKDKQVANGEKPPKSEILNDDPNIKDKDLDNLKKHEDEVDPSTKKKMEEDADPDVKKGKDHDSKAKALMMARVIVASNDKIDTPIPGLLAELAPLKAMKGVEDFKAEKRGNGKFEIYLIASKIKAGDYDIDPEKENNKENDLKNIEELILKPEAKYLKSGKHGLKWKEGKSLAKSENIPQGQWGSIDDLSFAGKKAGTLKPNEGAYFELPDNHQSIVHTPEGLTLKATHIWVRNNGSGTFHGYPLIKKPD